MHNIIIIAILFLITGIAGYYIYKTKKSGKKCIGCPYSNSCGLNKNECQCKH